MVGDALHLAFDPEEEAAGGCALVVVEAAAMRRIEAGDRPPRALEQGAENAGIDPALGAVAMQDVGTHVPYQRERPPRRSGIAQPDMALHGCSPDAERQARFHGREQFLFEGTAGGGIADDADFVAGGHLRVGEIAHVAEDAADRRSEAMDDAQGRSRSRRFLGRAWVGVRKCVRAHRSCRPAAADRRSRPGRSSPCR